MSQEKGITYNGIWRFPEYNSLMQRSVIQNCMGTLHYYPNKPSILEVYHQPSEGVISRMFGSYDTIWGEDANGYAFTLFNATMVSHTDLSKTVFSVHYCLIGRNVESIDTPVFDRCFVRFPYLKNWACKLRIDISDQEEQILTIVKKDEDLPILETMVEDGITLMLFNTIHYHHTRYDTTIKEDTILQLRSDEPLSIRRFLKLVYIFKQFLSIALFGDQHPCDIEFRLSSEENLKNSKLLYKHEYSHEPHIIPLLKYDVISSKVSDMLKKWYANFDQMSPICSYLVQSIHNGVFDTPNFLIVAQALDGYHKRFVNKTDGKDVQQYEHQIKKLLKRFEGVGLLNQCKLDAEVLAHTRHKYSHLIPDNETKNVGKAVRGSELFRLTRKAIVLLTCCILDYLGLNTEEINKCFEDSEVAQIVHTLSFYDR